MPRDARRPSLYQRVANTSKVDAWIHRRKEAKERKKNRKVVDDIVKKIGKEGGGSLKLDKDGVCCFPYKKFVICIEVADNRTDVVQFRTTVCPLGPRSNEKEVIKTAIALQEDNISDEFVSSSGSIGMKKAHDGSVTRLWVLIHTESPGKAVLTVMPDGVHMDWEIPIKGLKFDSMGRSLDEFLGMTAEMNKKFQIASTAPPGPETQAEKKQKGGFQGFMKCL